jgi:hypothetical protein
LQKFFSELQSQELNLFKESMPKYALLVVFIIFNIGLAFAISGIFGTVESFANTAFCKKFQCDLLERDDNFYGVSSRYEYLLKSFNGNKTVSNVSVRIIRDIDEISESILFIDESIFSSKFYAVISEFTLAVVNKKFTKSEIQSRCGFDPNKEATPKNLLFEQASNLFVYCGFVERKFRVKITRESYPTVRFDEKKLSIFNQPKITTELCLGCTEFIDSVNFSDERFSYRYFLKIIPLLRTLKDPQHLERVQRIRLIMANPPENPIGSLTGDKDSQDQIILPFGHGGYAIFLQSNFRTFQTKTLKGIRYLEIGGQDYVTPTQDAYRYHFAGFTRDGNQFIEFSYAIKIKFLPKELSKSEIDKLQTNEDMYKKSFQKTILQVSSAKSSDFNPSLNFLDEFINSLDVLPR